MIIVQWIQRRRGSNSRNEDKIKWKSVFSYEYIISLQWDINFQWNDWFDRIYQPKIKSGKNLI